MQFIPVAESVALRAEYEDQYNHFSPFKGLYYANIPLVLPYRKSSVVWSSLKVLQQLKLPSTDRSLTPGCSQIPLSNPGCHSPPLPLPHSRNIMPLYVYWDCLVPESSAVPHLEMAAIKHADCRTATMDRLGTRQGRGKAEYVDMSYQRQNAHFLVDTSLA